MKRRLPVTYHKLYGYQWDKENNRLLPNGEYENLKLIFKLLLDGWGYDRIINELKKRGVLSPSGKSEWNKTALSNMVHNPVYAGRYYALKRNIQFDKRGLWSFGDAHFSKYGTLKETIKALIENSERGYSASELTALLKVETSRTLWEMHLEGSIEREKFEGV